jgi:hypothetical protein
VDFVLLGLKGEVIRITRDGQTADIGISDMAGTVKMLLRIKN